jgi:phage pi2 protein 07
LQACSLSELKVEKGGWVYIQERAGDREEKYEISFYVTVVSFYGRELSY